MRFKLTSEISNTATRIVDELSQHCSIWHSDDVVRACEFMLQAHNGQLRKYSEDKLYYNHCVDVAKLVWTSDYISPVMLIAALLHDTIEDTDVVYIDIEHQFGKEVADIVDELTHVYTPERCPNLNRKERKEYEIARLSNCSYQARFIKLADRVSNLTDLTVDAFHHKDAAKFLPTYKQESLALFDALNISTPLTIIGRKLAS